MGKKQSNRKTGKGSQEMARYKEAWLKPRTALIVIIIASVLLAGYMFWLLLPSVGFRSALLWSLGSGGSIWAIFGLSYLFNRTIRRS